MAKTGTTLQGIMGSDCHLLFNYWRGKSYIAMLENEYCYAVYISSLKLTRTFM